MSDDNGAPQQSQDYPPDSAAGPDYFNVGRIPARLAQFPPTLQGQLARLHKQEWLDAYHRAELDKKLDEQAALLRKLAEQHADPIAIAAVVAETTARVMAETAFKLGLMPTPSPPRAETPSAQFADEGIVPSDPEWRDYARFRTIMCAHEQEIRHPADHVNALGNGRLTKWRMAEHIGVNPKTITRAQEFHRLNPRRDWPPSKWPEQERPKQLHLSDSTRASASLAAGLGFAWGALDFLSDGKMDGIVNVCRLLYHGARHVVI
jgi:hypothetical protein